MSSPTPPARRAARPTAPLYLQRVGRSRGAARGGQMASATGIELAGGPKLGVRYGRVDATSAEQCSPEGNLPDAEAGPEGKYGGAGGTKSTEDTSPNGHLRKVFGRMGLNDEEIVALSVPPRPGPASIRRTDRVLAPRCVACVCVGV
jgi:hypothetical protein